MVAMANALLEDGRELWGNHNFTGDLDEEGIFRANVSGRLLATPKVLLSGLGNYP